ncbi:MAG TPA: TrmH family RNA methyltransferase, partial [Tepidisphaeraceae bacterium]|nr:TrmH family RNA methyltransferase [Tepidisphaeraceae bacterium]
MSVTIAPHGLKVVLVRPEIPPNTGQIARLCVAAGAELHLVRPLGFVLSDRQLKRAAMDYWQRLKLTVHDDVEAFLKVVGKERMWL